MDEKTRKALNQINTEFYRITAAEFDQTRGQAWRGWEHLLPHLQTPLSVLDVGCGNGRFGVFLAENLEGQIDYVGIDNNPTLLEFAGKALADYHQLQYRLQAQDIIETPLVSETFDLVVLFGVMHHVPGASQRLALMQQLAASVADGGLLAFACWRFYEYKRFRKRIVAWDSDLQVEEHDYLLDWRRGERALRYCHYIDDAEHEQLIAAASGLQVVADYCSDGFTNDVNRYTVLRTADS